MKIEWIMQVQGNISGHVTVKASPLTDHVQGRPF
jgi:hypothetical protein